MVWPNELRAFPAAVQAISRPGQTGVPEKLYEEVYEFTGWKQVIKQAGLKIYPKLWQNLRSTCQTELADVLPPHFVCSLMGNSERVAEKHYLQVTDQHYDLACSALQIPTYAGRAGQPLEHHGENANPELTEKIIPSSNYQRSWMGDTGLAAG